MTHPFAERCQSSLLEHSLYFWLSEEKRRPDSFTKPRLPGNLLFQGAVLPFSTLFRCSAWSLALGCNGHVITRRVVRHVSLFSSLFEELCAHDEGSTCGM